MAPGWMPATTSASTARSRPGSGAGVTSKTSRMRSPVSRSWLSMITSEAGTVARP